MSHLRPGVLIAAIVFTVIAVYAFLAPATYRTSALVVVEAPGNGEARPNLPEPLEAARRLGEAILDRAMLEKLSTERAGAGPAQAQARAEAASLVRRSLEIDTSDAHVFSISYRDTDKERVQRVCNALAQQAVQRAPLVLADRSAERAQQLRREQRMHDLAAFLSLHPGATAAEVPAGSGKSADRDLALSAFHTEKSNIERRLQDLASGRGSDNPYLEPVESDPKRLQRRLAEINTALNSRRAALSDQSQAAADVLSPAQRIEWNRLLSELAEDSAESAVAAPAITARVMTPAPLPRSPIDPNRPLLLFFGAVFGCGLGTAFTLVARAAQQRRTKSTRPPMAPSPPLPVQVPSTPPLPTRLGPEVPVFQLPPANNGPPIVPIPQRQISSSPPAGAAADGMGAAAPGVSPQSEGKSKHPSSNPPPSKKPRFASTLVLPPAQNPAADPALAAATQAWDEQIRTHAVPGFAVVRPRSEPPTSTSPKSASPTSGPAQASVAPRSARAPNQMKVTQPLGSFLPDLLLNNPQAAIELDSLVQPRPPAPPPTSPPPRHTTPPSPDSRYSYVSSAPPADNSVTTVRPAPSDWAADASLRPDSRNQICEQLYPLAVQGCLVVLVVGAPESVEQKSRVAAELALAIAASGYPRILLMDGDTHAPHVHRLLNVEMPMRSGFSQQLRDRVNGAQGRRWTVVSCGKSLHVLAEGLMRIPGLLLSRQFGDGFADLRNYYDFIIIDGPSTSLTLEAQALDSVCDAVVFVCGKSGSSSLERLQSLFGEKRIKTVVTAP